ncbi:HAMP domain-containing sensor histidine kinase [Mycolicibacterium sp. CBMA 295]|uniref:HAMP domain-containing sensor histidine kinase n=1 Tax=Mycolicibacterium sp. CBMA 295 TaxID=2606605 RepID=UPI00130C1CB4|nr:HAMP domain-containing sensor histidine kinase [Mycolicibacterium sp. CBMA 295]MUM29272.1 HAMP domain-containing histidine kinase [Mycolicibacterium sp. CBMA 295]
MVLAVVLAGLVIVGSASSVLLYRFMCADVDNAAVARAQAVADVLRKEPPDEVESVLMDTDHRIVAVQVIDPTGAVARRSDGAPNTPMIPVQSGDSRVGVLATGDDDVRVSTITVDSRAGGPYTVLVGGGIEPIELMMSTVGQMLAITAPIVAAVAAIVTYLLVRRSLRSVEAIRSRVSEISASDLAERVPVAGRSDEISALAVTMNEMLARIEAGHAAQRRFVGDASHELRSPLATVVSALEIGVTHPDVLDRTLLTTALLPEARRMQSLVENLLLLARADEHGLPLHRIEVDLDDLATAEVARLRRETKLRITAQLSAVKASVDPDSFVRMLRNLADNAARHAAGEVTIVVRAEGDSALVQVADDGPGIPAAQRDKVFERFVRLDSDRSRRGGGTGLGLAIVAEIVAAHNGTVSIDDREAVPGTVVTVQLPLANSPDSSR